MSPSPQTKPPRARRVLLVLTVAAVGAAALAASGVVNRARSMQEVADWTEAQAVPSVQVVQPRHGPDEDQMVLPGTVSAFNMSSLYPRASGYVAAWQKDIGARVTKGELLATISAPDLDQQYEEAKAQLVQLQAAVQQAQATADLGQATDARTARLVVQGWSSKEQGDTDRLTAASRTAALAVAKANVTTQEAVVGRLKEMTRFEQIVAPFDGVITARNVDIGDLVTAGGTGGKALFQVADIHRMRVYVNVPQAYLGALKPGIAATLHLPGAKGTSEAKLVTTSNAVAESSRTASVELDADNADGKALARRLRGGAVPHPLRPHRADHPDDGRGVRRPRHAGRRRRRQRPGDAEAGRPRPQPRRPRPGGIRALRRRSPDQQPARIDPDRRHRHGGEGRAEDVKSCRERAGSRRSLPSRDLTRSGATRSRAAQACVTPWPDEPCLCSPSPGWFALAKVEAVSVEASETEGGFANADADRKTGSFPCLCQLPSFAKTFLRGLPAARPVTRAFVNCLDRGPPIGSTSCTAAT